MNYQLCFTGFLHNSQVFFQQRLLSCETVGGEVCDAEMYPEVKIKPEVKYKTAKTSSEAVEQEYFEYNELKT